MFLNDKMILNFLVLYDLNCAAQAPIDHILQSAIVPPHVGQTGGKEACGTEGNAGCISVGELTIEGFDLG